MLINQRDSLLVIVLLSSALFFVTATGLLLALKYKKYRSRPYLFSSGFFLFQCLGISGILLRSVLHSSVYAHFEAILKPISLITGLLTLLCILAYIVEIKLPGKLNFKKVLLCISPAIIVSLLLILSNPNPIHNPEELISDFSRPDVLLRLVIISLYFIYPAVTICLPYEWRRCLVSRKAVASLHILACLISPVFIAGLVCGYFPAVLLNYIIALLLDSFVAYIELKIRIPVTDSTRNIGPRHQTKGHTHGKQIDETIFDDPEIWMNPDMSATELAKKIGTNHIYLLERIKDLGYLNYSDMINRQRVEYICKELQKGTDVSIIDLMFEAGFRTRSTASREFKRIKGCSPSEYIARRK